MQREQWSRIQEVFQQAVQLDPAAVPAYLESHCENDPQIRAEVESLLRHAAHDDDELLPPRIPETTSQLIGQRIGPFQVTRLIAAGGMGTVYEAEQQHPSRTVALKVLQRHLATPAAVRRFQLESEVLGYLQHRNIAQVYQAGTHKLDGVSLPYFAMEYITDARPITAFAVEQQLDTSRRIELFARVCDAVHAAHQKSVIHRDLKPQNILVDQSGEPKVIDFGIARATDADLAVTQQTQPGQVIGTALYMSPEQYEGQPDKIDVRSDVYSLGVALYELLSGRLPYDVKSTSLLEVGSVIRENEPIRLSATARHLRGDVETVVAKAIEKQPERRYQSVGELADDLRRILRNDPITARPPSLLYWTRKYIARRRWQALAVAAALSTLLVAAGMFAWNRVNLAAEERAARQEQELLRQQNYGPTMTAVEAAIRQGDAASARRLLDYAHEQHPDLCGWEWRHLDRLVDQSSQLTEAYAGDARRKAAVSASGILAIPALSGVLLISTDDLSLVGRVPSPVAGQRCETAAFSPDGRWLVSTAQHTRSGSSLEMWDVSDPASPACLLQWDTALQVAAVTFHPYYPLLVCGGNVAGQHPAPAEIWQFELNQEDAPAAVIGPVRLDGHEDPISDLAFSPDGTLLASGSWDYSVRLWRFDEAPTESSAVSSVVLRGHEDDVHTVAFDASGRWLASGSGDSTIRVWDVSRCVQDAEQLHLERDRLAVGQPEYCTVLLGHSGNVLDLDFDQQEPRLYSSGNDRFVHCWELRPNAPLTDSVGSGEWSLLQYRELQRLPGHGHQIESLSITEMGEIITLSRQGTLRKWLPGVPPIPALKGHTTSVRGVVFHPDDNYLVSCSKAEFMVWDAETGTPVSRRIVGLPNHVVENVICWQSGDRVLLALSPPDPRSPILWDVTDVAVPRVVEPAVITPTAYAVKSVAVSATGERIAAVSADGTVHRFRRDGSGFAHADSASAKLPGQEHYSSTYLDEEGNWLVVGGTPAISAGLGEVGGLSILEAGRESPDTWRFSYAGITSLHRRGNLLAGGSRDGSAYLWRIDWSVSTGSPHLTELQRFDRHDGGVTAVCLHPTEPRLVTGGIDSTMRLWDIRTGNLAASVRGELGVPSSLAFDAEGERLAITSGGSYGAGNVVYLRDTSAPGMESARRRRDARRAYDAARLAYRLPARTPDDVLHRIRSLDLAPRVASIVIDNLAKFAPHPEHLLPRPVRLLINGQTAADYQAAGEWLALIEGITHGDAYTETVRGAYLLRTGQVEEAHQVLAAALSAWEAPFNRKILRGFEEAHVQCVAWLALAKFRLGDRADADALFERAVKLAAELPDRPTAATASLLTQVSTELSLQREGHAEGRCFPQSATDGVVSIAS